MKTRVFTDGACSKNPGPGGWAIVFNTEKECFVVSGNEKETTNNRMELKAVIEALKKIEEISCWRTDEGFELYSDSAYVVNSINNHWIEKWQSNSWKTTMGRDVKNRDLWEAFIELRKRLNSFGVMVEIFKVKGHSGDSFNELADGLAKEESEKAKEGFCDD